MLKYKRSITVIKKLLILCTKKSLIQVLIRVIIFSLDDEFSKKKKIKFLKFNFEIDENIIAIPIKPVTVSDELENYRTAYNNT